MDELVWSTDVGEAAWIAPRLAAFSTGTAGALIPSGYPAYARLLHPLVADGRRVRWRDIAAWSGLPLEPGVQFPDIAVPERRPGAPRPAAGERPFEGTLGPDTHALAAILAHCSPSARGWFCFWEGSGFWSKQAGGSGILTARTVSRRERRRGAPPRLPGEPWGFRVGRSVIEPATVARHPFGRPRRAVPASGWVAFAPLGGSEPASLGMPRELTTGIVPQEILDGPRVELPARRHLLATGPIVAATTFTDPGRPADVPWDQSPNLWWPEDRSWCVATDVDLQWSYLAGSRELVDEVLASAAVEAQRTSPGESTWRRDPAWVVRRAEEAATEAVRRGRARVDTGWGVVDVELTRPARGGYRDYAVRSAKRGSSGMLPSGATDAELAERIRRDIAEAIVDAALDAS